MKTILAALACTLIADTTSAATANADTTLQSYSQARAVLGRALDAAGGEAAVRSLRNVTLDYAGHRNMINQSRKAAPPWDREPATGALIVDREGKRFFHENYTSYPGIGRFGGAWALKGDRGAHWEPLRNHHGSEIMMNYSGADSIGAWAMASRWVPPFLLLEAWDSGTNVRSLGSTARRGQALHAIVWTQPDKRTLTMLFDAASGAFHGYETVRDEGVFGDVIDRIEYSNYRAVGGVSFPARRTDWFNDEIAREVDFTYRVDTTLSDAAFELPAGFTQPAPAAAAAPRLLKVADGVYLDTEIGGIMIVEFRDFLVVVECPGDFEMSNSTLVELRKTFPNKPVKYVVPSHTHGDHGGGARAYFANGTTLLTTPGHADFYRQLAKVTRTISPDSYDPKKREPSIETFRGKRTISDGTQTMVLHDIGPNAHSEELTIVHLPRQRVVWQADVYFSPGTGGGVNPAMPIGIDFAKKLKSLGIRSFDALLEAHNARIVTVEEFRRALALSGYRGY
jgi:glyoxylase-like metal-dependent hydrolase (beta-lactamase superfamily II)